MREAQRISTKLDKFRPSLTLGLKSLVQERAARGLPVYDFGLGETKGRLNPEIRAAGEQAFREEETMYADPGGLPELRAAVLRRITSYNVCYTKLLRMSKDGRTPRKFSNTQYGMEL